MTWSTFAWKGPNWYKRDQARYALAERQPCFWHVPEFGFQPLQSNGDKCAVAGAHELPPYWSSPSALLTSTKSAAEDYINLLWSLTGRGDTSNRVEMLKESCKGLPWYGTIPTIILTQCQVFWHFFLFFAFTSFTQKQNAEGLGYTALLILWIRGRGSRSLLHPGIMTDYSSYPSQRKAVQSLPIL